VIVAQERLQKILSAAGLLSRRAAEEAIVAGRVQVNGKVVTKLGSQADPAVDRVVLDGNFVGKAQETMVLLLNKPRQTITTKKDPQGRKTVLDLIPKKLHLLNPVGRLDYESEGLLLFTNDGELANRLMHPSFGVRKIYEATVQREIEAPQIRQLITGIELDDGLGRFESIKLIHRTKPGSAHHDCIYEVEVSEGRNWFVRRMLRSVRREVKRLVRTQQGPLKLGKLPSGEFRPLSSEEVETLKRSVGLFATPEK
jgi:23S rRNA pseudouridine2605 synthase